MEIGMLGAIALLVLTGCARFGDPSGSSLPSPERTVTTTFPTGLASVRVTPGASPTLPPTSVVSAHVTPGVPSTLPPSPQPSLLVPTPRPCSETHGRIIQAQIQSHSLAKIQNYRIYLPACYDQQPERHYPSLYLLHGAGHDDGHWDSVGVDETADSLIDAGQIAPLLIILPDGNRTYGSIAGDPSPFAGFLLDELIPHIDATYRTQPNRTHRAIGGISLGGAWALMLAARYPDIFGAVGGHSPAIGPLNAIYPNVDTLVAGKLRIYLDVGNKDSLRAPTTDLDAALDAASWPHQFHVYPGSHIEAYWSSHLGEYLRFYSEGWKE